MICANRAFPILDVDDWMAKGYKPTPTIVEAAEILYRTHSVTDISRSDAGAKNLQETSASVSTVIDRARQKRTKAICFVTGVPGSGKTLAGLNIATLAQTNIAMSTPSSCPATAHLLMFSVRRLPATKST